MIGEYLFSFLTETLGYFLAENAEVITRVNILLCVTSFIAARLNASRSTPDANNS